MRIPCWPKRSSAWAASCRCVARSSYVELRKRRIGYRLQRRSGSRCASISCRRWRLTEHRLELGGEAPFTDQVGGAKRLLVDGRGLPGFGVQDQRPAIGIGGG